jgi:hypothetical protein
VTWVMWNLILVRLHTVLVSEQDRCTVCAERTKCLEIILDAHDVTAMCCGCVEYRFGQFGDYVSVGLFGDSANLDARKVHGLRRTCHRLKNNFGCTRWNS